MESDPKDKCSPYTNFPNDCLPTDLDNDGYKDNGAPGRKGTLINPIFVISKDPIEVIFCARISKHVFDPMAFPDESNNCNN